MASRQAYSKADDDAMWRYLHQQVLLGNEDAYAPMGVKIWKTASESGVTNKSVHSMTCHFRRKLLPAIHKSPLSRNDVVFLLNKWSLADAISLRNINEDVTIEQYEDSISSADDVIVQSVVIADGRNSANGQRRRRRVGVRKRLAVSPFVAADGVHFATGQQSPQATTSNQPLAKSPRITLADALLAPSKNLLPGQSTVTANSSAAKSSSVWPLAEMEELEKGKESLKEMKDVDATYSAFEYSEPESTDFQSKLLALVRQGAIPPQEIETVAKVQTNYVIELAKEFNISLRVIVSMVIANDEFRNTKKLREALTMKKERARMVKTEILSAQTAETNDMNA